MNGSAVIDIREAGGVAARRELPRLVRSTEFLRAAVVEIGRLTDLIELARSVATHTARLTRADRVLVGLIEDDEFQLRAAITGGRLVDASSSDWPAAAVIAATRRTQQPVASQGEIAVPAVDHQGRVSAVVVARHGSTAAAFTATDVRQIETLLSAAAVGFDRGKMFERLVDWNRSMEMLLAFNAAINQHLAPPKLVRRLVEHAARLLNSDAGFAGLVIPDRSGDVQMESDGYWANGAWHEQARHWRRGEGTPGFVLDTEFPYFSNEYPRDPLADAERVGVVRAMCVPIKNERSQVLGFFELHRSGGELFSWHDAAFLESLANTAAVAVENARLWRSLEESNRELQAMSASNARQLEDERRHIARELHDETGQALIGIKIGLQAVAGMVPGEMADVRSELDVLRQQVNDAAVRIKNLAHQLRPPTLDHCGLPAALRQLADDFRRRTEQSIEMAVDEPIRRLPAPVETAVYRIAQEALTNTAKHAAARSVRLALHSGGAAVRFTVTDDGRGFDPWAATTTGLGLLGMRERVAMLGGEFRLTSEPGVGTTIDVLIRVSDGEPA